MSDEESADERDHLPEDHCPSGCRRDSVYRFVVVYPELHRIRRGHYWSCDVFIAILMFVFTAVCQVCIVQIAGGWILSQSLRDYHSSVQTRVNMANFPVWLEELVEIWPWKRHQEAVEEFFVDQPVQECCRNESCSAVLSCCMPGVGLETDTRPIKRKPQRLDSLCFEDNGDLDCAQTTFQLIGRWEQLDVNGDNRWTHEEAVADASNLGCRLQLSQVELFRTVCAGIAADLQLKQELGLSLVRVPLDVELMLEVRREHFELWEGVVVLCAVMDQARCGALMTQGVFDGALGWAGSGGWKLGHALEYCGRLLMPGGICDKTMPVTYALHRQKVTNKCGQGLYSSGPSYANPHDEHDTTHAIEIRYEGVIEYELVNSNTFKFYTWIMLILWLVTLNKELSSVLVMAEFALHFPAADVSVMGPLKMSAAEWLPERILNSLDTTWLRLSQGKSISRPIIGKNASVYIEDISDAHRTLCWIVLILRSMNLVYMLAVGIIYATCTHSYLDLLMNTVALAFVFELPELFYEWLLPESIKDQLNRVNLANFYTPNSTWIMSNMVGNLAKSRFLQGLAIIPLVCFVIVQINDAWRIKPMLEVMLCACGQVGDHCMVGWHLRRAWWDDYWAKAKAVMGQ